MIDHPRQQHLDKLDAVARLAGGLSRDLGHLVEEALAGVRTAHLGARLPSETARALDEAREALQRAQAITRQLAAFGRTEPVRTAPLLLASAIAHARPLLVRLAGPYIEVIEEVRARDASLVADAREIEQLLLHLAVNARDAMPLGGRLTVATDVRELEVPVTHAFGTIPAGRWSVLEVRDTGTGMDADVVAHLFEPYFTTKGPGLGSGLGLATVFGIARRAGGQVVVETAPGIGTAVAVWFPWHHHAASRRPDGGAAVLVVDADPWLRTVAGRALRREGYAVLEAEQGSDALALLRDVAGQHVGVVLTDGAAPGGDGTPLAEVLRRERPGLRVVALGAGAPGGGPSAGAVRAPLSREALLAAVAAA